MVEIPFVARHLSAEQLEALWRAFLEQLEAQRFQAYINWIADPTGERVQGYLLASIEQRNAEKERERCLATRSTSSET